MEDKARAKQLRNLARRYVGILVPGIILVGLIGWRVAGKITEHSSQMSQRSAQSKASPIVSVSPVQIRDIVQTFDAIGNVEAPLNVKIAPKITGRITYLRVQEGDRVRRGEVLVKIDPSEVEAQMRQQQAAVAEARYRLAQAQLTQGSTDIGISTQIRQQEAAAASAQADYNQSRENYTAQLAAADAAISDADGKIAVAEAAIAGARAAINSAQANLDNAQARYNRATELYKKGFVSGQTADDAKAFLSVQEAGVEVAQGQLKAANAQRDSALAQKRVAEQQAKIVGTKGKADIEAAKAKLAQANAAVEYARANTSQKAAYQQSIAALRSAVDAAKAGLRSAQARRADTVLMSPLDGFVTDRYVDPGAVVTAGQPAISVQFMRQIWVAIAVPEEIVPKLHIGQPARVSLDAFPNRAFAGNIIQINPSADAQSRQFTVRVILNNAQNLFKPGMYAHVRLETDRTRGAVAVPREAVQHDEKGDYVILAGEDGKANRQQVVTGESDAAFIAVTEGLRPGESVVTMSAFPLRDGQPIRTGAGREGGRRK